MVTKCMLSESSSDLFISHQVCFFSDYSECFKIVVSNWKISEESSFVYRTRETICRPLQRPSVNFLAKN